MCLLVCCVPMKCTRVSSYTIQSYDTIRYLYIPPALALCRCAPRPALSIPEMFVYYCCVQQRSTTSASYRSYLYQNVNFCSLCKVQTK